jgi:DNA-3-methyladenine glycosylase II
MDFVDHLSKIIVGQQLSVASAAAIWARTEILLNKNKYKKINNNLNTKFKNAGLSRQKIEYLNGIIFDEKIQNLTKNDLQRMSHSDFYEFLIKIKGIGPWSIEMSRIFYVGDADVFSILDLGLKNAHIRMFDLESYNEDFYKEFSPYRSYMCLYMWRVLEDENVTI